MPIVRDLEGVPLSIADLPPPGYLGRWTMKRKANLVLAIRGGIIERTAALKRYTMSNRELLAYERAVDLHGYRALRATKLKDYRHSA